MKKTTTQLALVRPHELRHTRELHGTNGELLRRSDQHTPTYLREATQNIAATPSARSWLYIPSCRREPSRTTVEPPMGFEPHEENAIWPLAGRSRLKWPRRSAKQPIYVPAHR